MRGSNDLATAGQFSSEFLDVCEPPGEIDDLDALYCAGVVPDSRDEDLREGIAYRVQRRKLALEYLMCVPIVSVLKLKLKNHRNATFLPSLACSWWLLRAGCSVPYER